MKPAASPPSEWETTFVGGGEMGDLMRALDWAATPVGDPTGWPTSLKTAVRIMLGSRYPMFVWWGRQITNLYNDAYIPMLGKRHPAALGQSAAVVWHELWDVVGPQTDAVLYEGQATWNEERLLVMERYGYPEETYFTFAYSPIPNDAGGVGGLLGVVTEDTQKVIGRRRLKTLRELGERTSVAAKTAEAACRAAAEVLALNAHDLPFALLYLVDPDGRTARLAGSSGLAFGADAAPAVVSLADGPGGVWPLARIARTRAAELVEDLAARWGPLPGSPWPESPTQALVLPVVQSGQDQPAGFLVAGISVRRPFDEEYRGFLELIAGHVGTAVTNARAYEEEKRRAESLAELDRAKTAFFSNVSHEFRTPLTLLLGPVEDALNDAKERWQRDRLEVIHRNGLRLQKLVNALLDFSRTEAGRVRASYEPTDLAALTAELASNFRSACDKAGLGFTVDCPPLPQPVCVDREMWEKVLLNLLSNAFKFTLEGEIAVSLSQDGDAAKLTVRDTGTGISAEQLPHIFERFHRVEGVRARTHEGTGIGLALVQELVKLHGGTVVVASVADRGTTFTVTVPFGTAHLPAGRVGAARTAAPAGVAANAFVEEALRWLPDAASASSGVATTAETVGVEPAGPRPRVLVADDNADMRDYLRKLLAGDYEVTTVSDGREALAAATAHRPDLVLTDVMMPDLDGFGLLAALRADQKTAAVPVIMLSARAGQEARVEGLRAGADDYLVKPFVAQELLARVGGAIALARVRREAGESLAAAAARDAFRLRLADALRPLTDAAEIAAVTAEALGRHLGVARCLYDEVDPTGELFCVERDWTDGSLGSMTGRVRFADFGDILTVFRAGRTLVVNDTDEDARTAGHDEAYAGIGVVRSAVGVPLVKGGRFTATFGVHHTRPRNWTPDEVALVEETAERTWAAVERARAEQATHKAQQQVQFVSDAVPALLSYVDRDCRYRMVNQAYEVWFGHPRSEVVGRHLRDILGEAVWKVIRPHIEIVLSGKAHTYEAFAAYKDGGPRWISVSYTPDVDETGAVRGFVGLVSDITRHKQMEEALRDADRRKDEFLATLAHELRNPLAPVRTGLQVLKMAKSADATEKARDMMDRQIAHMVRLIDDLLDVSRVSRGKVELKKERVDVRAVVEAALEVSRPLIDAGRHGLFVSLQKDPLPLDGDPTRLAQVVSNLLNNAAKYTPDGGRIELSAERDGDEAVVRVRDNGAGIPEDMLARVFDLFTQVGRSLDRAQGGLGIGLSLVKKLVEMHGGAVAAESAGPGAGSTFTVRLPLAAEPTPPALPPGAAREPARSTTRRVLVVDDNVDGAESLAMLLGLSGHEVRTAHTGPDAVAATQEFRPEVVLLDIGLPGMNGYEVAERLRREPGLNGTVLVALTGWGSEDDRRRAREAGFDFHLTKPVEAEKVEALLVGLGKGVPAGAAAGGRRP